MIQLSRETMFWAAAGACTIAEMAIILSSIRTLRRSDGSKAARETIWAVLPAIALAWLFAATLSEVRRSGMHEHNQEMTMPMPTSET
jgi:hypothetical protein